MKFDLKHLAARFARSRSGATAIEYGLIAALMAVALIAAFSIFGGASTELFNNLAATVSSTGQGE